MGPDIRFFKLWGVFAIHTTLNQNLFEYLTLVLNGWWPFLKIIKSVTFSHETSSQCQRINEFAMYNNQLVRHCKQSHNNTIMSIFSPLIIHNFCTLVDDVCACLWTQCVIQRHKDHGIHETSLFCNPILKKKNTQETVIQYKNTGIKSTHTKTNLTTN